jgi:iron complex outermembrane receptor protein
MKTVFNFLVLISLFGSTTVLAQAQEEKEVDLYELSLEELLNIPINSASRKDETLFDAPLSSYTITRADIDKAGSTTIMEALRLAPGVIVREQANGVYDIHIRGLDNILRTSETYTKSNLTTLVMIDNRPVFNHNLGGTFWEALPIDLNDVDRIEIVRGPSAPLFGPNAVTGVINIITKRANTKTFVNAAAQYAVPGTTLAGVAVGSKLSNKFNFSISGNYQDRERFDDLYYIQGDRNFKKVEELNNNEKFFPNSSTAMNRWGVNGFVNYKPSEKVSFDLTLGSQSSETQKVFLASGQTLFTTNETKSQYANLAAKVYGLTLRTSYTNGFDDLSKSAVPARYDYKVADVEAEYEVNIGNKVTIVPGVSYQSVAFNDADYVAEGPTFLGGKEASINTTAGFLRVDAKPIKNLRVIAAIRADKFSSPDDVYLAYEFATTYKLNESNIIRAAITRSNSGSFIGLNYLDLTIPTQLGVDYKRVGNTNLDLFTVNMIELGYRVAINKNFQIDIDLFNQVADNYTALLVTQVVATPFGPQPIRQEFLNIPTSAEQNGVTIGFNYVHDETLQIKPFITIQKTETKDLPAAWVSTSVNPAMSYSSSEHEATPSFYGGYFINYKPVSKLNLNLNSYYFASHQQHDDSDPAMTTNNGGIKGKLLVNLKVNYAITKKFNVFLNGRNLLNSDSREFYGTDRTGGMYGVGATLSLN